MGRHGVRGGRILGTFSSSNLNVFAIGSGLRADWTPSNRCAQSTSPSCRSALRLTLKELFGVQLTFAFAAPVSLLPPGRTSCETPVEVVLASEKRTPPEASTHQIYRKPGKAARSGDEADEPVLTRRACRGSRRVDCLLLRPELSAALSD